jgi:SAM-dependent methyltransferase
MAAGTGVMTQEVMLYSDPIAVEGPDECLMYHGIDLPGYGSFPGLWDLRGRFDEYTGHVDFRGRRVLDIGTAGGFLSFEAEKRGAEVVSVDIDDAEARQCLPFPQNLRQTDPARWLSERRDTLLRAKKGYWLAHRALGSHNRVHYGNVYRLPAALGAFDIVIIGQILVHLRDVITALEQAADRCQGTLVIAEGMIDNDASAVSHFLGRADRPQQEIAFWHHSTGFYIAFLGILGFRLRSKSIGRYICNVDPNERGLITTLVFDR